ncbi:lipase maturation factor family protein [bacterium]|nr:lipase maturation factor family protein [bacterium]
MPPRPTYLLTRFAILRLLALVYAVAFLVLINQAQPLLGAGGLLPVARFLAHVRDAAGSSSAAVLALPTLFWIDCSDATLLAAAWLGLALSLLALAGITNALLQLALWGLYLSFVQVGQLFYGYGWETQLLETGFLAVFLCPLRGLGPFRSAPPRLVIWLFRWLIMRIMLGAAAIKLRGDPCWRDFTCLVYHYETQPVPNPLSWWLNAQPRWFHVAGVAVNHFVELIAPVFVLGPRRLRAFAGICFIAFQVMLILSGNLSFLNWLTIVPALACFDDAAFARLLPRRSRRRALAAAADRQPSAPQRGAAIALTALVAFLSINVVANLLSPRQAMNRSYDRLHLVNTYGAFGSVGRERDEVILEGTSDDHVGPDTRWQEYQFPCKPGDVTRRPCVISPYHYRADWQMWFAAMSQASREPWLIHLIHQLLRGDPAGKRLLAVDPFPTQPPRFIRAQLYRYQFTRPGDGSPDWWRRTFIRPYLPPVGRDDPDIAAYLRSLDLDDEPGDRPGREIGAGTS